MRSVPAIIRMLLIIYDLCDEYGIYMIARKQSGITRFLGCRDAIYRKDYTMLFRTTNRNGWI